MEEVDIIQAFWGTGSSGGGGDVGDAVGVGGFSSMVGAMAPSGGGGGVVINRVEITVSIDRGTPEEADRAARQIGQLLSDRDRLLALARR